MKVHMANLQFYAVLTLVVFLSFALQFKVVLPLETVLLPHMDPQHASLLFLPHGIGVLLAFLLGVYALPVLYLARLVASFWFMGGGLDEVMITAALGTLACFLPVVVLNFLTHQPWHVGPGMQDPGRLSLFRLLILLVVLSSLFNSLLHSYYYAGVSGPEVAFRYLFGDMAGSFVVLAIFIALRRKIASAVLLFHRE